MINKRYDFGDGISGILISHSTEPVIAIFSTEDTALVSQATKWSKSGSSITGYFKPNKETNKGAQWLLHRWITGTNQKSQTVYFANNNHTDFRRENLVVGQQGYGDEVLSKIEMRKKQLTPISKKIELMKEEVLQSEKTAQLEKDPDGNLNLSNTRHVFNSITKELTIEASIGGNQYIVLHRICDIEISKIAKYIETVSV